MKQPAQYSSILSEQNAEPTLMDAIDLGQSQYADGDPFLLFLEERRYATSRRYFNRKTLTYYGIGCLLLVFCVVLANWAVSLWGLNFLLDLSMYSLLFVIGLANWLDHHDHPIAAGILVTIAMALMPVAIYSLENVLGFWNNSVLIMHSMDYSFDMRTLVMAAGSMILGLILLWRFSYSYLVLPVLIATLAVCLDVIPVLQMKINWVYSPMQAGFSVNKLYLDSESRH